MKSRLLAGFMALVMSAAAFTAAPAATAATNNLDNTTFNPATSRGEYSGHHGANSKLCLALKNALMRKSDIPSWLAKKKIDETRCSMPGKKADRPLACFEDRGADIWGDIPKARAHRAIKLGGEEKKGAALEAGNTLYSYKTRARAVKAWNDFTAKLRSCPADATINRGDKKEKITIRQQQQLSQVNKFKSRAGFAQTRTLRVTGTGISNFTADISNYVVYRLVGKVIIRVYLNKSTQVSASTTLTERQKQWVRQESIRVGKRIAKSKVLR